MSDKQSTVADIFRRAQQIRHENPSITYKQLKSHLMEEYKNAEFPPVYNLTIPEQDARAPEEDWSAGLPLVLRGIQRRNWQDVADGIVLSLEQTENYVLQHGPVGVDDDWHDRSVGIRDPLTKGVSKWMPQELLNMAERQSKK